MGTYPEIIRSVFCERSDGITDANRNGRKGQDIPFHSHPMA